MGRKDLVITIFKDGHVAFTNLTSELIDVALEVDPGDKRILDRKVIREKGGKKIGSEENGRD